MTEQLTYWLYPELRGIDTPERARLLAKAREGDFDMFERGGLAIALLLSVF